MTDFSVTRIDRTPDKIYMGGDEAAKSEKKKMKSKMGQVKACQIRLLKKMIKDAQRMAHDFENIPNNEENAIAQKIIVQDLIILLAKTEGRK